MLWWPLVDILNNYDSAGLRLFIVGFDFEGFYVILQIWTCSTINCVVLLTNENVKLFADYMLEQHQNVF